MNKFLNSIIFAISIILCPVVVLAANCTVGCIDNPLLISEGGTGTQSLTANECPEVNSAGTALISIPCPSNYTAGNQINFSGSNNNIINVSATPNFTNVTIGPGQAYSSSYFLNLSTSPYETFLQGCGSPETCGTTLGVSPTALGIWNGTSSTFNSSVSPQLSLDQNGNLGVLNNLYATNIYTGASGTTGTVNTSIVNATTVNGKQNVVIGTSSAGGTLNFNPGGAIGFASQTDTHGIVYWNVCYNSSQSCSNLSNVHGDLFDINDGYQYYATIDINGNMGIKGNYNGTAFNVVSQRKLKNNIVNFNSEKALEIIRKTNIVQYCYKTEKCKSGEEKHLGFIADDTDAIIAPGHKVMDTSATSSLALEGVKLNDQRITKLENISNIQNLQKQINLLEIVIGVLVLLMFFGIVIIIHFFRTLKGIRKNIYG